MGSDRSTSILIASQIVLVLGHDGEAKVGDYARPVELDQDILGLDVTMRYRRLLLGPDNLRVEVDEATDSRVEELKGLASAEALRTIEIVVERSHGMIMSDQPILGATVSTCRVRTIVT